MIPWNIAAGTILSVCVTMVTLNLESVHAQSTSNDTTSGEDEIMRENVLESLMSYSDDVSEVFTKIDLNAASSEELLTIPGMSSQFASSIIEYREKVKSIHSMNELSSLDGATPELLSTLSNRAQISQENNLAVSASSYTSFSPQKVSMYQSEYHDNGIRNFQKLCVDYGNAELDAVSDKDPGENSYLDFYSLALSVKDISIFSAIDLGNYSLSLGNGLLFSNSSNISKSAGAVSPLFSRNAYSLKPYKSLSENGFLRGAAFAIPFGNFQFTGFTSSKNLAAHENSSGLVTSIDYSGLNLSTSTTSNLSEKIGGGILRFDSPDIDCGASAVYFSYGCPFTDYYLEQRLVEDVFLRSQSDRAVFSGELLADKVVSYSANAGLNYEKTQFAVGVRNLQSRMTPNYSGALSESFPLEPEQGIYFGATFHPEEIMKLGFYYDRFTIMSTSGAPDRNGEEIFADSNLDLNRERIFDGTATVIYFRYRYKTKEDFYIPESEFPAAQSTLAGSRQNFRIDLRHNFSSTFSIRTRFEKNFLSSGETGELFLFDAASTLKTLSVNTRICFYNTDSYNSAFYEVEEDLPGIGQYSLLYGDGARLAVLTNLKITRSFSAGVKVSRDIYDRTKEVTVGSDSQLLPGTTYVSMEISWKFE
ncbi:MAG: ComEA family DNA-binding protein [Candidatus Kryptoniota bacterium]